MRKGQKEQLQELLVTLSEAHDEVKSAIKQKDYQVALDVLAACQECAIEIGNAIEEAEGENAPSVLCIQKYCESLFIIYSQIENDAESVSYAEVSNALHAHLTEMVDDIEGIKVKTKVAFFPYKASMWDSLESIWRTMSNDEKYETYVIPIPYYEKNPDGTLGQMYYEGREYPAYVPVIDWQSYSLENAGLDMAYIHNPYDDWNYVTSVHPYFYSSNLRKYIDELVYVPYFVLGDVDPDNQQVIDRMKHFCFLPGTIYATKVIVESENVKKIYVDEYLKAAKANGLNGPHVDREYLEKKIQGSGSPKYEKVLNTKKNDVEIPKEWLPVIIKPDGTWKKIVFYNTSVQTVLDNDMKAIEKIGSCLEVFRNNSERIALLWRPHPLLESTLKSLRPELWAKYTDIVASYREAGWGIFDDTPDMNRAVVLSDAYYGDGSSIVHLYKQGGKPIMVADYSKE